MCRAKYWLAIEYYIRSHQLSNRGECRPPSIYNIWIIALDSNMHGFNYEKQVIGVILGWNTKGYQW